MPVGSKLSGKTSTFYFGVGAAAVTKQSGFIDAKINYDGAVIDAADHDGPDALIGQPKATIDVNMFYLDTDTNQQALVGTIGANATNGIEIRPNGDGTGKTKITGVARVASWDYGTPVNGAQTINVKLAVSGQLTWGTQP